MHKPLDEYTFALAQLSKLTGNINCLYGSSKEFWKNLGKFSFILADRIAGSLGD